MWLPLVQNRNRRPVPKQEDDGLNVATLSSSPSLSVVTQPLPTHRAKKYDVHGLIQACIDCLKYLKMNDDNVLFALGHARLHDLTRLIGRCWSHIDQHIYAVIEIDKFLQIDLKLLEELLGRGKLKMSKEPVGEIALWNAALRWADEKCRKSGMECSGENRRRVLGGALFQIRLGLIDWTEFSTKIVPSRVLSKQEVANVLSNQQSNHESVVPNDSNSKFPTGKRA